MLLLMNCHIMYSQVLEVAAKNSGLIVGDFASLAVRIEI